MGSGSFGGDSKAESAPDGYVTTVRLGREKGESHMRIDARATAFDRERLESEAQDARRAAAAREARRTSLLRGY